MNRFNKTVVLFIAITVVAGLFPYRKTEALFYVDTLLANISCDAYEATIGRLVGRLQDRAEEEIEGVIEGQIDAALSASVPVTDITTQQKLDTVKKGVDNVKITEKKLTCEETLRKISIGILKKRILDVMVDQTIAWIQGEGKPQFITDYKAFLQNTQNIVIGDIVQEIGLGRICEPFKFQLQVAVTQPRPFSRRAACTLSDIVGNIEDFYNDFANGGWIAYNESLKMQNNVYGAYLLAEEEKENRLAAEMEAAAQEVANGGGFLDQKRCLFWSMVSENGDVVTQADGGENRQPPLPMGPFQSPNYQPTWKCTQAEIVTPGRTIGDTVSKAIGSDFDFIINAEDIGAYVSAIADAAINRLVKETVNGLAQMRAPTINLNEGLAASGCEGLSPTQRAICESETSNYYDRTANQYANSKEKGVKQLRDNIRTIIRKISDSVGEDDSLEESIADTTGDTLEKIEDFESCIQDRNLQNDPAFIEMSAELSQIKTATEAIRAEGGALDQIKEERRSFDDQLTANAIAYPEEILGSLPDNQIDRIISELEKINNDLLAFFNGVAAKERGVKSNNQTAGNHLNACNAAPGGEI